MPNSIRRHMDKFIWTVMHPTGGLACGRQFQGETGLNGYPGAGGVTHQHAGGTPTCLLFWDIFT